MNCTSSQPKCGLLWNILNTEMKNATLQLMLFSVRRKTKNITSQSKQTKKEMNTEYAKDLLRHQPSNTVQRLGKQKNRTDGADLLSH